MEERGDTPLPAGSRGHLLRKVGAVLALTVLSALSTLLCAGAAWADTFTVTNTSNGGAGSLRAAMNAANAGADQIAFADGVSGTITLSTQLPTITDPAGLAIDGGGDVTVSGNDAVRVFEVGRGAELSLRSLTVSDGLAFDRGGGGALAVEGSTFSRNLSDDNGGAIYNDEGGTLEVSGSAFSGNDAANYGAGIFNSLGAKLTVSDSTFSGNHAAEAGAGIANLGGTLEVSGSTFSTNEGDFAGGGIENDSGTAQVTNSTFYANESGIGGGIDNGGVLTVTNSTFSGNSASESGGAISAFGAVTLRGTVLAESPFGGSCQRQPIDGGYNVSDDGTCGFDQAPGSLSNTDPMLDPQGLQDNGGPTETIALQPDSPAVDLVGEGTCPPPDTDQRGVARPQGEACDSGAFELEQGAQPFDATAPRVDAVSPAKGTTGVARGTNLRATFSERMDPDTIGASTFRLFKVTEVVRALKTFSLHRLERLEVLVTEVGD
jgi:predicted outer membrane repeat protein